ncbi:hypothetical protein SDRG_12517 [Saprolegnia diclina VS20]|uniref:Peptidase M16C associated domain-containing protein n=1 Tax=Saprolegnia diclina (strain VS20) TaxID=1156394 RepID=T0Q8E1_SAPDV|nr:hypothetical protein SDRG_12517 [Saprolegnia diclina VS20]EQC29745.1 hypothetical protein SDRG_12517 [Saprolegnia diclina VS20]|eukprot:XP_008616811.1 hypothetical protein SDRG_12517 [Saprolegnia diclina VS20]
MLLRATRFARATRRLSTTVDAYAVGSTTHGFKVVRKEAIPEYSITAIQLQHEATKADYLHIDSVDSNNVFSVNFRTPPTSSNGIAHILEHLVLCGSKQYPVRDPFFNMLKRSLNNFMNAMTGADHTMYPFATTNRTDFDNLLRVYLDATFFPRLRELDFLQEGHRLALDETTGHLQYKGVVFNEMKGTLSDSDTLFATRLQQHVMPTDSVYAHVSGGDPTVIPSLSHDELKAFHATHYHPSNALFYSYGNFALSEHLAYINDNVLSQFEAAKAVKIAPSVVVPPRVAAPLVELEGPDDGVSGDAAAQTKWVQAHVPDVDCLPTLTLQDIPLQHPKLTTETRGVNIQFVPQSTNELTYFRLKFDTSRVPTELKPYLPFFASVLGQLGTSQLSFQDLATTVQSISGGVSASTLLVPDTHTTATYTESLLVETLCLPHKVDATLACLVAIFTDTQFTSPENVQQLKTLLTSTASAASASVASSGHQLAATRAQYGLTAVSTPYEQLHGLTAIDAMQAWLKATEDDPAMLLQFAAALSALAQHIFQSDTMRLSVVTEPHLMTGIEASIAGSLVAHLPKANDVAPVASVFSPTQLPDATPNAFFGYPLSVNFNVQAIPTVPLFHPDHVPLTVLAQVLSSCYLHQHVREKGGAYGAGASQGEGVFQMSSYYDPHTLQTLEAYDGAATFAATGAFSHRDVDEALLGLFSSIDAPQAPSAKGKGLFTRGFTHDMLQARRSQLLATTKDDVVRVAQTYLASPSILQRVIVGKDDGREALRSAGFTCN